MDEACPSGRHLPLLGHEKMPPVNVKSEYRSLGLRARFALALRALEAWCFERHLNWPGHDLFFDLMWQLPVSEDLAAWDARAKQDDTIAFAMGDECQAPFLRSIETCALTEAEVRTLFACVLEVAYSSFYSATDDAGSIEFLSRVFEMSRASISDPSDFGCCRFDDAGGWGYAVSEQARDHWRYHKLPQS